MIFASHAARWRGWGILPGSQGKARDFVWLSAGVKWGLPQIQSLTILAVKPHGFGDPPFLETPVWKLCTCLILPENAVWIAVYTCIRTCRKLIIHKDHQGSFESVTLYGSNDRCGWEKHISSTALREHPKMSRVQLWVGHRRRNQGWTPPKKLTLISQSSLVGLVSWEI